MDREDVIGLLSKSLLTNVTECIRRFKHVGVGATTTPLPWALLGLVKDPQHSESESRVAMVNAIRETAALGNVQDGFTLKFLHFFQSELDSCVDHKGTFGGVGYQVLNWLHNNVVGDVQHVEAKNSILRVMSTRARAMHKDLMSSRHVIKARCDDLVTAYGYTKSFRNECNVPPMALTLAT